MQHLDLQCYEEVDSVKCGHKADSFPLLFPTSICFFYNWTLASSSLKFTPKLNIQLLNFLNCVYLYWQLFLFLSAVVESQYDPRFGDAFWNSSKFGMVNYLLRMMSSWAIVCSVWYLPPMSREVMGKYKIGKWRYLCSALFAVMLYILNRRFPVTISWNVHKCFSLKQEGEDAVHFANRVKAAIARQGGLVDLLW